MIYIIGRFCCIYKDKWNEWNGLTWIFSNGNPFIILYSTFPLDQYAYSIKYKKLEQKVVKLRFDLLSLYFYVANICIHTYMYVCTDWSIEILLKISMSEFLLAFVKHCNAALL